MEKFEIVRDVKCEVWVREKIEVLAKDKESAKKEAMMTSLGLTEWDYIDGTADPITALENKAMSYCELCPPLVNETGDEGLEVVEIINIKRIK